MDRFREGLGDDMQAFKDKLGARMNSQEDNLQTFKDKLDARMKSQEAENNQSLQEAKNVQDTLKGEVRKALQGVNETMHKETAAMKQTLVHDPVLFTAHLTLNLDPNPGATIIFGTIIQNVGNGYDASTGLFTAPINGTYLFSVQMCINNKNVITYEVMANERRLSAAEHGDAMDDVCSSTTAVGILSEGDTVFVRCIAKALNSGSNILEANDNHLFWTMFTGVLIHPTV